MAELTRIHSTESSEAINVVFVHGLGGHAHETWMCDPLDENTLWPKWIGEDANCNVWIIGYDAALSGWTKDAMHLQDQGIALMSALLYEDELAGRPLLLVGHSLGGLVIKSGMVQGETLDDPRFLLLLKSIAGVVFVGTPHQGSGLANVAVALSRVLRTNQQVANMKLNDAWLKTLTGQFRTIQANRAFEVNAFFETHGCFIGYKIFGIAIGSRFIIVDRNSSDPQIPRVVPTPIEGDHIEIAKPPHRGATIHKALVTLINKLVERGRSAISDSTTPSVIEGPNLKNDAPQVDENGESAISASKLRQLAVSLLEVGSPPSLINLYPSATKKAVEALKTVSEVERLAIEVDAQDQGKSQKKSPLQALAVSDELKHLIVGSPGSGKTHALWHTANKLLQKGDVIPIFLPVGRMTTWEQVAAIITDVFPDISVERAIRDPRVCVCIDGWSEFAVGEHITEKSKVLRVLQGSRVIANARLADAEDALFKVWTLEPLAKQLVVDTVSMVYQEKHPVSAQLIDFLRQPLLFSLYILSEGTASGVGNLLQQFHSRLARNMPEGFSEALCGAVAAVTLAGDRSYGRLVSELQLRSKIAKISEPLHLLELLGSITNRGGQAVPVHDLYWSWLCGCGLLLDGRTAEAIRDLSTRESFTLALQSGRLINPMIINETVGSDILLAAEFDAFIGSGNHLPALEAALDCGLIDHRLAIKARTALACIRTGRAQFTRRALDVISELRNAKLIQLAWQETLNPSVLFPQRGTISDWLGSPGSDIILESIAKGGPEWVAWLEQMASSEKISWVTALGIALACSPTVPAWGRKKLDDLFASAPWELRLVTRRRSNFELASIIANDYERIVEHLLPKGSSGWIDVNQVLVACGDDSLFEVLLSKFARMGQSAQELLGYAVVDRGGEWIAKFQVVAFSTPGIEHHHKLAEIVSPEIDDETARRWIAMGYEQLGWRVLIARHGNETLPELIDGLPSSFDGLHRIPTLEAMSYLEKPPESLVEEIWSRVKGNMQPKAMQDVLAALGRVEPAGVLSMVKFIMNSPQPLPAYHLRQAVRVYEDWRKKTGIEVRIDDAVGSHSFQHWIVSNSALNNWDSDFTPRMLGDFPELAIEFVLKHFGTGDQRSVDIMQALKSLKSFQSDLFFQMLSVPKLAALIPGVFAECLDTFPENALSAAIHCPHIQQNDLLYKLSVTSNPVHKSVHIALMKRVLSCDINIHHYGYIANMLRAHPRHELIRIFEEEVDLVEDNSLFFIRQVEMSRKELFLQEDGFLLS